MSVHLNKGCTIGQPLSLEYRRMLSCLSVSKPRIYKEIKEIAMKIGNCNAGALRKVVDQRFFLME